MDCGREDMCIYDGNPFDDGADSGNNNHIGEHKSFAQTEMQIFAD